jgi:regulator of replication initiation timing
MALDIAPDMIRWVQEGQNLFAHVLQTLHRHQEVEIRAETLAHENRRLREENEALREELDALKAERLEVVDTLKTFAEQVTRVATAGIQRLGAQAAAARRARRPEEPERAP